MKAINYNRLILALVNEVYLYVKVELGIGFVFSLPRGSFED